MGRYSWLIVLALGLGMAVAACGSGGGPGGQEGQPVSTETPRSERAEREATIMEQQAQQVAGQAGQAGQDEPAADTPIESGAGEVEDEAAAAGVIDFGHREGLPFARNVVGDPDAPVVIVEYSDFQ